jgi:ribosomal protein L18E
MSQPNTHALLAELRRPAGRLLAQQILAELRKIEEDTDNPLARDVAETLERARRRDAERRRRKEGGQ